MHPKTLQMPISHTSDPPQNTLRRLRSNHAVEGTMTSTPSHAVWRTVPPTMLVTVARQSQPKALRSVGAERARWHRYRHSRVQNRPGMSVMKVVDRAIKTGESAGVKVPKTAFPREMPKRTRI